MEGWINIGVAGVDTWRGGMEGWLGSIPGGGTMEGWINIGVDGVHTWRVDHGGRD